jgi:hypothetical protein
MIPRRTTTYNPTNYYYYSRLPVTTIVLGLHLKNNPTCNPTNDYYYSRLPITAATLGLYLKNNPNVGRSYYSRLTIVV